MLHLVWFKRDLRIEDHPPLATAAKGGKVLPLYIVEEELWQQPDRSLRQWQFARDSLLELRVALGKLGQPLLVRTGAAIQVLEELRAQVPFGHLLSHEETGTAWTRKRDQQVAKWCNERGVIWREFPSNGVVRGLKNRDDWAQLRDQRMQTPTCPAPDHIVGCKKELLAGGKELLDGDKDLLDGDKDLLDGDKDLLDGDKDLLDGTIPECPVANLMCKPHATCKPQKGGRARGLQLLNSFLNDRALRYNATLSKPGPSHLFCSRLSAHLCFGTLSLREVEQALRMRCHSLVASDPTARSFKRSLSSFQSRIAWRCHFTQKLEDHPSLEFRCLHSAFEGLREPLFDQVRFRAWREGQTGYPLVDACMRWLHATGWLTFRMRAMLVAFASYHLWLDWRPTAHFLAQMFTDYEPGIHYPQFQMQSGVTGINATRMYNPTKQAMELDPEGDFIRKCVPELALVPTAWIHKPWELPANIERDINCRIGRDYPAPIVEQSRAIGFARGELTKARRAPGFKQEAARIYEKLGSRKKRVSAKPKKSCNKHVQLSFNI